MTTSLRLKCRNCGKEIVKDSNYYYDELYRHTTGNWLTCYPSKGFSPRAEPLTFNDYLKQVCQEESTTE